MHVALERQKYLIDYTLAALLRRKTRNLGLLLVYALLVFPFASVLLLSQGLRREAAALLQDAPTANLDSRLSREVLGLLDELAEQGRTVLISSHDPLVSEAARVRRRVELRDGRLIGDRPC